MSTEKNLPIKFI